MKKTGAYILIALGLALILLVTNRWAMEKISNYRTYNAPQNAWWSAYHAQAGDLANMAYLGGVPQFTDTGGYRFSIPEYAGKKNTDLYVWGDSYTMDVPETAYTAIHTYHYGRRSQTELYYQLDTTRMNILIICIAERFVREYFQDFSIYDHVRVGDTSAALALEKKKPLSLMGSMKAFIDAIDIFSPSINQNIEFSLFNYHFINPLRIRKAMANWQWFGRASGDVVISENGQHLFLSTIMNPRGTISMYSDVTKAERDTIINHLNILYTHYKKEGFHEVYLSLLPNPATILQPAHYNRLIPVLQTAPGLKMPVIDIYSPMKAVSNPVTYYKPGDTHWNTKGLYVWLDAVNEMLKQQDK